LAALRAYSPTSRPVATSNSCVGVLSAISPKSRLGSLAYNITCRIISFFDVLNPTLEEQSMFITTYIVEYTENFNSTQNIWNRDNSTKVEYFINDVEDYRIELQHSVRAPSFSLDVPENTKIDSTTIQLQYCDELNQKYSKNSINALTLNISCDPNQLWDNYTPRPTRTANGDIILVGDLLKAAFLNLDQDEYGNFSNNTLRIRGIAILFYITYNNFKQLTDFTTSYTYRASALNVFENPYEIFYITYNVQRIVRIRSGIRINMLINGELVKVDLFELAKAFGSYFQYTAVVGLFLYYFVKWYGTIFCKCCKKNEKDTEMTAVSDDNKITKKDKKFGVKCCSWMCENLNEIGRCVSCKWCDSYEDRLQRINKETQKKFEL